MKSKTGRPRLNLDPDSMRVGFVITKEQWLNITEMARKEKVSFSEIVRRALDAFTKEKRK